MRGFGATLVEHGEDFEAAREAAMRLSAAQALIFVPSFHVDLVIGVATWALELFRTAPPLDALYVPIGLGSGICGAILHPRPARPADRDHRRAEHRRRCLRALRRCRPRGDDEPLGDQRGRHRDPAARPGGVRDHPCRRRPHRDGDRRRGGFAAIRAYWTDTHNLAEGAGAAPLAGLLQERAALAGKRVGVVLCGGNIDLDLFRSWVLA